MCHKQRAMSSLMWGKPWQRVVNSASFPFIFMVPLRGWMYGRQGVMSPHNWLKMQPSTPQLLDDPWRPEPLMCVLTPHYCWDSMELFLAMTLFWQPDLDWPYTSGIPRWWCYSTWSNLPLNSVLLTSVGVGSGPADSTQSCPLPCNGNWFL